MNVNVEAALMKKKLKAVNQQESDAMIFAQAIACQILRENYGFGRKRLQALMDGMLLELAEHFMKYRDDEEEEFSREIVPSLYTGLKNQVLALDIRVVEYEADFMPPPEFPGWRKAADREKRRNRWQLIQDREKTFCSVWYAMILYLWRTYDWGEIRLNRFYRDCRERYGSFCADYLNCRPETDARCQKRSLEVPEEIKKLGVKL